MVVKRLSFKAGSRIIYKWRGISSHTHKVGVLHYFDPVYSRVIYGANIKHISGIRQ